MKTAVAIPDDVFHNADRVADRLGWSRSKLYTHALEEFLAKEGEDPVTSALDALADDLACSKPANTGRALIDAGQWEW